MSQTKRGEKRNHLCDAMLCTLTAGALACAVFALIYARTGAGWALSVSITGGVFAYHMLIRFLVPAVLGAVTGKSYNPRGRWFSEKPWEKKLYRALGVKHWKGRALTFNQGEFSLAEHTAREVIINMCHSEAVHELNALLSLMSVLFAIPFGSLAVFLITAALAAAFDLSFAVIQRFNRPRLLRIADRRGA